MNRPWKWFLAIIVGFLLMLDGLFWDVTIHGQQHGHIVEESLLDLGNPGHVLFGLGLVLTTLLALGGFSVSWWSERPRRILWPKGLVPAILWLVTGLAGVITLVALAQTS